MTKEYLSYCSEENEELQMDESAYMAIITKEIILACIRDCPIAIYRPSCLITLLLFKAMDLLYIKACRGGRSFSLLLLLFRGLL